MENVISNKLNVTVMHENPLSAQIPIPPTSLFIQDGFLWLSDVFAIANTPVVTLSDTIELT